ncbi:endonuclease/exonuclease/phosphatase family protein [Candidatus Bathyarchaeota archaeon]|nr:endonuclease/exonuclease/phosphatase family protein [Candidatus Bathyarchaeota archaeon]
MLLKNLLAALALVAPTATAAELPVRVVSFNIRLAATNPGENEKPWETRAPLVTDIITSAAADVPGNAPVLVGMQEVLHNQLTDLEGELGGSWAHIGVGRDDGEEAGEYSPIFYESDVLDVVYEGTKWLSETPDKPSYGCGANIRRVVTTGVFEHKETKQRFIAANTHLDHETPAARIGGVNVIIERLHAVQEEYGPLAVSLTGDFNSQPGQDAYEEMAKIGYLEDVYEVSNDHTGPDETYTGFVPGDKATRIDYIYVGPKGEDFWEVGMYEVVDNVVDGVFASDHRPVVGDLTLLYEA